MNCAVHTWRVARPSQAGRLCRAPHCSSSAPRCVCVCMHDHTCLPGKKQKQNQTKPIGHHARPRRASATAPLRTGADICKTGSAAGKCAGAKSNTVRRRSNHARTEDQAGREKCANTDVSGEWRVHTAVDTPRRNAATRSKHLSFMCQGDIRPRAAAGSILKRNPSPMAVIL